MLGVACAAFPTPPTFHLPPSRRHRINAEFPSVAHFNRLVKFAACALIARASLFFGVDFYESWYTLWADTARRCGFEELAAVLGTVDLAALKKESHARHPDEPGVSRSHLRLAHVEQFTVSWFDEKVVPLLDRERRAAISATLRPSSTVAYRLVPYVAR